jgi:5-methylcytosine-specific restriction endonuclease McrA
VRPSLGNGRPRAERSRRALPASGRIPDGDLATIVEEAIDLLIEHVKKDRFAIGRKPRKPAPTKLQSRAASVVPCAVVADSPATRHIPDALKRAVYKRDGGRCTFMDDCGRRCPERGAIEFDHVEGYARARKHSLDDLRLLCRAHNQRAAERMYGRAFMEQARRVAATRRTRPGTTPAPACGAATPPTPRPSQPLLL